LIDEEVHRKLGAATNNRSWTLIESPDLSESEAEELLITAMASVYHWSQVGDASRFAARDLLAATALLRLGCSGLAEPFVKRAFASLSVSDHAWERAFAHAILAWHGILSGNKAVVQEHYSLARELGEALPDAEDRMIFFATYDVIPLPN